MKHAIKLAMPAFAVLWVAHVWAAFRYPLGNDPAIFQYHAWALTVGEVPYLDSLDVNTPGIILLHWLWGSLFGFSDGAFLALTMLASTLSLAGAIWVLKDRVDQRTLVVALGVVIWAFVSITPWDRGQRELFQGVLLLAAFYAGDRRRDITAGVLAGLALTIKVTLPVILIPVAGLWLWPQTNWRKRLMRAVLGFALPVVAVLGWLGAIGAWDAFWWTQLNYLPHHSSQFTVPWTQAIQHPLVWVCLLTGISAFSAGGKARVLSAVPLGAVALYFLQHHGWVYHLHVAVPILLPALALSLPRRFHFAPAALLFALLFATTGTWYDHTAGLTRAEAVDDHWDYNAHEAVASYLDKHSDATDRVLTNNDEQQLLYMARRRGATRCLYSFICSEAHTEPVFQSLSQERLRQVERRSPQWVVWNTRPYATELDSLAKNPKLQAWIAGACREDPTIGPYRVWRCP